MQKGFPPLKNSFVEYSFKEFMGNTKMAFSWPFDHQRK